MQLTWILLGILYAALAVFFGLAALKTILFGRPQLRKLRENHADLAEKCEALLEEKLVLRVALQFEAAITATAATALVTYWFLLNASLALWIRWVVVSLIFMTTIIAFLLFDLLSSLPFTAKLLLAARPFAKLLAFIGCRFKKIEDAFDERNPDDQDAVTAEDAIRSLVEEDNQEGEDSAALEDDLGLEEKRMLTGVMDLDRTLVHEIMTPRVDIDAISQDLTTVEAKAAITKSGHSRIPVFATSIDAITGILYAKDLLDDTKTAHAKSIREFTRPPIFIPESKNVADLLKDFRSKHNHMAVVLDEYGGTSGIVTIEDILEEIVGEIEDEFDRGASLPAAELDPDGTLTLDARTPIWEINQRLDVDIPEDEGYDTLAGYIMTTLGRIPKTGEHVDTPMLDVEILCASPRRLITLKVRKKISENPKD